MHKDAFLQCFQFKLLFDVIQFVKNILIALRDQSTHLHHGLMVSSVVLNHLITRSVQIHQIFVGDDLGVIQVFDDIPSVVEIHD
jgi:hypothetical protein